MHNGNKSYNWVILPKQENSEINVKGSDEIGNTYEGVAVIKEGKIEYIVDAWEIKK